MRNQGTPSPWTTWQWWTTDPYNLKQNAPTWTREANYAQFLLQYPFPSSGLPGISAYDPRTLHNKKQKSDEITKWTAKI